VRIPIARERRLDRVRVVHRDLRVVVAVELPDGNGLQSLRGELESLRLRRAGGTADARRADRRGDGHPRGELRRIAIRDLVAADAAVRDPGEIDALRVGL